MSEKAQENKVAMVIAAHPDDAEFACGGTVAQWVLQGWRVVYVILTDGSGGGPDDVLQAGLPLRKRVVGARQQEQRAACAVLGVDEVIFLGYPDNELQPTLELRRQLVRILRHYRPTRVICQSPDRSWAPEIPLWVYHPDHLAAGRAALEAIYPASQNPWDFPELLEEGLMPHKVSEIYIMDAPTINHGVNITETIAVKETALRAHESQFGGNAEGIENMVALMRTLARQHGQSHSANYAEQFHLKLNQ